MQRYPIAKDLVLVGGGHSHVIVLWMLAMKPVAGLRVTLVSPDVRSAYSGMLPGVVAGHYTADDIHIELGPLCRLAGARLIVARATGIDPVRQTVQLAGRPDIDYDVLSIDVGITPAMSDIEGDTRAIIAVKPINGFLDKFDRFIDRVRSDRIRHVAIVGAGAGGVELCLAVHHRLQLEQRGRQAQVHLVADEKGVLPEFPAAIRDSFSRHIAARNIEIHENFRVAGIEGRSLVSTDDGRLAFDDVFLVTRAAPHGWLAETGFAVDANGFIRVRDTLQTISFDNVFAVGDTASVDAYPRPKAGVYAVRQGPPLHRNLLAVLHGRAPRAFKPQENFLALITTGEKYAVATRGPLHVEGRWMWRLKNRIDRRFMNRFNRLPRMKTERMGGLLSSFDAQMQCGGCGAKVSADLLREVLSELGLDEIATDDAAVIRPPPGKLVIQSVDAFRAFIEDPYDFARITANHALSDLYAMGAQPHSALASITVPFATPARGKSILREVMTGALEVFGEEGVELLGGHTTEGPEMSLGFTVNGLADEATLLRKRGVRAGDALVLTKALGTGVIFAGDMQTRARGAWVEGAMRSMLRSNRDAARVLRQFEVHALTDVTGFGLAGHLGEMLATTDLCATISLDSLPILHGVLRLMDLGVRSTLHEGNRRSVALPRATSTRFEVVFDPQTSGGLLAALPQDRAQHLVDALVAAGYPDAAVIGHVGNKARVDLPHILFD